MAASGDNKMNTNMPMFTSHMTLQEAFKLKIHDKIDHRDVVGRFVYATGYFIDAVLFGV